MFLHLPTPGPLHGAEGLPCPTPQHLKGISDARPHLPLPLLTPQKATALSWIPHLSTRGSPCSFPTTTTSGMAVTSLSSHPVQVLSNHPVGPSPPPLLVHSQVISSGVKPSTRRDSSVSWNSSRSWLGVDASPLVRKR